ncbi:hypothetical protein SLEP1_g16351 [Rubroshorea leprosula]|uniref:Ubiquitin carboxyl-terminal hydrolase n=1 Tax=Rubroshorea leprosula TaxID=152421 RepID=A0AAV5IZF4_9ROSI|nr:hypothetical protein SLEP1_g16351 [Rubroshorea leprosula]
MGLELQMTGQRSLISGKRKKGPPIGLRNLGNSCYLNSVLQCLTYTPPLANFCLRYQHSSSCDSTSNADRKRDCPFCLLEKQIVRSLSVDLTQDEPVAIQSWFRIFAEHFRCGRQEDAHEFLRYVIDACHNTCLRLKKLQRKGSEPFNGNTVVKEIFGGALQSQVKCLSCGAESNKLDEIMDISLDIAHSSSLKDAMHKFFQPELLDDNNKYKCESCKKLVAARKQMSIHQAPNILVIQLKRFGGIFGVKIDKDVALEEVLVLSSFMCKASQDPEPEYNLFGTIVHSGYSPESGHYYAYIKDAIGRWYCCDDSSVSVSTRQKVLSEKVYILFFSRANQRPRSAYTTFASRGLKTHDSNGNEVSKSPNVSDQSKSGNINATVEQLPRKETLTKSNVGKMSSSSQVKFNISEKSGSKRVSPVNGRVDLHKAQNGVTNGGFKISIHSEKNVKDTPSMGYRDFSDNSRKLDTLASENGQVVALESENGQVVALASENGGTQNSHAAKSGHFEGNGTRNMEGIGKSSGCHELMNGGVKCFSDLRSKRKPEDSCVLLVQDAQSRAEVENLKAVLRNKASSVLRSCGWIDEVYSFMRSRRRLCAGEGGNTESGSDLKKKLIADARSSFISKVPQSLKEDLVNRLSSFSQEKREHLGP